MSESIVCVFLRELPNACVARRPHRILAEVREYEGHDLRGTWLDVGRCFVTVPSRRSPGVYIRREVSLPRDVMDSLSSTCEREARAYFVSMREERRG